jgi:hypothetical protein
VAALQKHCAAGRRAVDEFRTLKAILVIDLDDIFVGCWRIGGDGGNEESTPLEL